MTQSKKLSLAATLTFVGAAVSVFQTNSFFALRSGAAGLRSFCQVGSFDCVAIEMSKYAEIAPGIPLSALAAGWLFAQLGILIHAIVSQSESSARFAFITSSISLLTSLIYIGIMAGVMKVGCILCLTLDALNLLIFGTLFSLKNTKLPNWKLVLGAGVGAIGIMLFLSKVLNPLADISTAQINEYIDSILLSKPVAVSYSPNEIVSGPSDASVTIVKFSDFECPACKMGAQGLHPVLSQYKSKVRFVFKNHPLDNACNRAISRPMHHHACELARIGLCAQASGKFESIYETLFENQEELAKAQASEIYSILKSHGVTNADELKACAGSPETTAKLSKQIEEGLSLGIASTPTFYVNGIKVEGGLPTPAWKVLIERLSQK